jgi:hypothetical protein
VSVGNRTANELVVPPRIRVTRFVVGALPVMAMVWSARAARLADPRQEKAPRCFGSSGLRWQGPRNCWLNERNRTPISPVEDLHGVGRKRGFSFCKLHGLLTRTVTHYRRAGPEKGWLKCRPEKVHSDPPPPRQRHPMPRRRVPGKTSWFPVPRVTLPHCSRSRAEAVPSGHQRVSGKVRGARLSKLACRPSCVSGAQGIGGHCRNGSRKYGFSQERYSDGGRCAVRQGVNDHTTGGVLAWL